MNRRKAEQWISRALDGELSPGRQARLARALENDPALADLRRKWASYRELLRAAIREPAQTPEAAWQDVRRAIRLESGRKDAQPAEIRFGGRVKWASAMAVTMLLLLGGIYSIQYRARHETDRVAQSDRTIVEWVESDLPDAMSMVYEDEETGLTVIWVLTAENGEEDPHAG